MKNKFILLGIFFIQNVFSMQNSSENVEISLSILKEESSMCEKILSKKLSNLCVNIDRENVSYKEFSHLLQRLYEKGIFNITVNYKGRILDISSKGMEWDIPVELPNSSKEKECKFPSVKEIKNEQGKYTIIYWKINNVLDKKSDMKEFSKIICSSKIKNIGLFFVIDSNVTIKELMEYFLLIPINVNIRGVLFNNI